MTNKNEDKRNVRLIHQFRGCVVMKVLWLHKPNLNINNYGHHVNESSDNNPLNGIPKMRIPTDIPIMGAPGCE